MDAEESRPRPAHLELIPGVGMEACAHCCPPDPGGGPRRVL